MRRIFYFAVVVFWAVMSFLLVQSEFGDLHSTGIPIPPEVIWRKVVLATDPSLLAMTLHGPTNRLGSFKCVPGVVETAPVAGADGESELPEGMAASITGYTLDLDGNMLFLLDHLTNHLRISLHLKTDTNLVWQMLHLQMTLRPETWTIEVDVPKESVTVRTEGSGPAEIQEYKFKDLANPQRLLRQFGGLMFPEVLALLGTRAGGGMSAALAVDLDARKDHRLKFGSQKVRCLRLKATVLGNYSAQLYVNPQSGEILRIDFPNQISFINETLL